MAYGKALREAVAAPGTTPLMARNLSRRHDTPPLRATRPALTR